MSGNPDKARLSNEALEQIPAAIANLERVALGRNVRPVVTWDTEIARCLEDGFGETSTEQNVVRLELFVADVGALHDVATNGADTQILDHEIVYKGMSHRLRSAISFGYASTRRQVAPAVGLQLEVDADGEMRHSPPFLTAVRNAAMFKSSLIPPAYGNPRHARYSLFRNLAEAARRMGPRYGVEQTNELSLFSVLRPITLARNEALGRWAHALRAPVIHGRPFGPRDGVIRDGNEWGSLTPVISETGNVVPSLNVGGPRLGGIAYVNLRVVSALAQGKPAPYTHDYLQGYLNVLEERMARRAERFRVASRDGDDHGQFPSFRLRTAFDPGWRQTGLGNGPSGLL